MSGRPSLAKRQILIMNVLSCLTLALVVLGYLGISTGGGWALQLGMACWLLDVLIMSRLIVTMKRLRRSMQGGSEI